MARLFVTLSTLTTMVFAVLSLEPFQVVVDPPTIQLGVTRSVSVNCTISAIQLLNMSSIMSIIMSFSDVANHVGYVELVSITSFNAPTPLHSSYLDNAVLSGKINNTGSSYLSLSWEFPDLKQTGMYKCEAHGMDTSGHHFVENRIALVSIAHPETDKVAAGLQSASVQMEQMNAEIQTLQAKSQRDSVQIEQMNAKIRTLQAESQNASVKLEQINVKIRTLQAESEESKQFRNNYNQRMDQAKKSMFKVSDIHNGHRYHLSDRLASIDPSFSQGVCEFFGGYLVEIDTAEELNFVRGFIRAASHYNLVLTGGTDEGHEGTWTNRHSKRALGYVRWTSGQPNQGTVANCMYLWGNSDFLMCDDKCNYFDDDFVLGYMCEVPA